MKPNASPYDSDSNRPGQSFNLYEEQTNPSYQSNSNSYDPARQEPPPLPQQSEEEQTWKGGNPSHPIPNPITPPLPTMPISNPYWPPPPSGPRPSQPGIGPFQEYSQWGSTPSQSGVNPYQPNPIQTSPPGAYGPSGVPIQERSSRNMILIVLVVLVMVGSMGGGLLVYSNNQRIIIENANATATMNVTNTVTAQNVTATTQTNITATAVASKYPFSSVLKLDETLTSDSGVSGWEKNEACEFVDGGYRISSREKGFYETCMALLTDFNDFTYQVSMKLAKGEAGLLFRGDDTDHTYYAFAVDQEGFYWLYAYKERGQKAQVLIPDTATTLFKPGIANELGVVARGNRIMLYMNQQILKIVNNVSLARGQIGMIAYYGSGGSEAIFTNAKVWQL